MLQKALLCIGTFLLSGAFPANHFTASVIDRPASKEQSVLKAAHIRNFPELFEHEQEAIVEQIWHYEQKDEVRNLTPAQRLPAGLMSVTRSDKDSYVVDDQRYRFALRRINWIPSVELFYELQITASRMQDIYPPEKLPPLPLVMALLSHETLMRNVKGDGGLSTHMCQLYRPSARYITEGSRNRDIFRRLVYFDQRGEQQFYSTASMLEFVYHFLILEKGYRNGKGAQAGVSAYNGKGEKAEIYGMAVLKKTLVYEALIRVIKAGEPALAVRSLEEWAREPLSTYFLMDEGFRKTAEEGEKSGAVSEEQQKELEHFKLMLYQELSESASWFTRNVSRQMPQKEWKAEGGLHVPPLSPWSETQKGLLYGMLVSEGMFFVLEQGRTVFSYLRQNTFEVMTRQNRYHFFYYDRGAPFRLYDEVTFVERVSQNTGVFCSANAGDTVYVAPGYPIYNVPATQIVRPAGGVASASSR